jgi:hypothetical protein
MINQSVDKMRKTWFPCNGNGHQSENFDLYLLLEKSIKNYINSANDAENCFNNKNIVIHKN